MNKTEMRTYLARNKNETILTKAQGITKGKITLERLKFLITTVNLRRCLMMSQEVRKIEQAH